MKPTKNLSKPGDVQSPLNSGHHVLTVSPYCVFYRQNKSYTPLCSIHPCSSSPRRQLGKASASSPSSLSVSQQSAPSLPRPNLPPSLHSSLSLSAPHVHLAHAHGPPPPTSASSRRHLLADISFPLGLALLPPAAPAPWIRAQISYSTTDPYFRIYSDRRIDRLVGIDTVPAGSDPTTGVTSKDVVTDSDYVRLYLPDTTAVDSNKKLPVLVYFHGGGFVTHSAASPPFQPFLNTLAAQAGLAPEHPLSVGYEDPWVSRHGDLGRVFLSSDSAGGNFVHNVAMMAASAEGAVLLHAAFGGRDRIDGETPEGVALTEKLWGIVCLDATDGVDDPRMNPLAAAAKPSLRDLPCQRVLVCAAELDFLRPRNRAYYEGLAASGRGGAVEWFESKGKEHNIFLHNPSCGEAVELMDRLVAFFADN